jgi:hypothetical protein
MLFGIPSKSLGADLTSLSKAQHVHLAMLGFGPLCNGKVEERSADALTIKLEKTTSECGRKGETIRVAKEKVSDITPQDQLTKGRIAAKVLLGLGGVAALATIPLHSSDRESWLLLANGVLPGFIVYGAWKAVPNRRDYLVFMTCPDRFHCFSDANRSSK